MDSQTELLRAELDAAFFHLDGLNRDDTAYILDTFPIVRRKDEQKYNPSGELAKTAASYPVMPASSTGDQNLELQVCSEGKH